MGAVFRSETTVTKGLGVIQGKRPCVRDVNVCFWELVVIEGVGKRKRDLSEKKEGKIEGNWNEVSRVSGA